MQGISKDVKLPYHSLTQKRRGGVEQIYLQHL